MLLAGDVGGTKTTLAIFSSLNELETSVAEATFKSGDYDSLEAVVRDFLGQHATLQVDRACFGVAGPVIDSKARITNLPWVMDQEHLQQELGIPIVHLINDLEAMATAVPLLKPNDLHVINEGQATPHGVIGVVAPGTGLGEAFLTWEGTRYQAHATEGGHSDFGPTNAEQIELLRYLLAHDDHVSYEDVCAGIGLPRVYAYFKDCTDLKEDPTITERLATAKDQTPVIVDGAMKLNPPSPRCLATLNMFVSILGAEAGNLALKILATGGIYIGGGIPPRILPMITDQPLFLQAFCDKGRFRDLLSHVPVYIMLNQRLAMLGAAAHGFAM